MAGPALAKNNRQPAHGRASLRTTTKNIKMNKEKITPGTQFATGRPATGRNKTITIRISERAAEILKDVHNKSELIDNLIITMLST